MRTDKNQKLIPAERREKIEHLLQSRQLISSLELCETIGASESTIRRDLELMEQNGILERVHGGAILTRHNNIESLYNQNRMTNQEEKQRIADYACSLIHDNDVVFLNHGSTTTLIAQSIAKRTDLSSITVISSNLGVITALSETDCTLICLGGAFRKKSFSLIGGMTTDNIGRFIANKCFLGVDGLDVRYGCTYFAEQDAEVSRLMARNTHGQIYIVADNDKWGTVSPYSCIPFSRIGTFITGKELTNQVQEVFDEHELELCRV